MSRYDKLASNVGAKERALVLHRQQMQQQPQDFVPDNRMYIQEQHWQHQHRAQPYPQQYYEQVQSQVEDLRASFDAHRMGANEQWTGPPPPSHPRHMLTGEHYGQQATWQQPSGMVAPYQGYSERHPPISSLPPASHRHYSGPVSQRPMTLYTLPPTPSSHGFSSTETSPLEPVAPYMSSRADDFMTGSYTSVSPILANRRPSTLSATLTGDFSPPEPYAAAGLGITYDDRPRRYSELAEEANLPIPPARSFQAVNGAGRRRDSSGASGFPSLHSLPQPRMNHRGSFSNFVTQHMDRM
ncbi:hypothetical protein T439DRAFT_90575 [Meredithblackwellia eburnea MCA 4105]